MTLNDRVFSQKTHKRVVDLRQSILFWFYGQKLDEGSRGGNLRPRQTRGPPPKGIKVHWLKVFNDAHLSGLNSSASLPKMSFRL